MKFRAPFDEINSLNSSLWGTVKHVDWDAMIKYRLKQIHENEVFEISMHKGLMKLYSFYEEEMSKPNADPKDLAKRLCICALCFDDPNKPLRQCIIGMGNKATSNIGQHNNAYHDSNTGPMLYTSVSAS